MYNKLKQPPYQNWFWRRRGTSGSTVFDPITEDPDNNLLLFDAQIGLTTDGWEDQASGGNDMTFPRSASLVTVNALNAVHHTIATEGQYGQVVLPAMPIEPDGITMYFVQRSAYTGNRFVTSDGRGAEWVLGMRHSGGSPKKTFAIHSSALNQPTFPADYTWHVSTVQLLGGAGDLGSGWRINKETKVTSANMPAGKTQWGIVISADKDGAVFTSSTCEWAYILIRSGIDDEATQDAYIDFWNERYDLF